MSLSKPELPPFGLTLQAPWGALIAWGWKDVENRSYSVASAIGSYRGRVALTASASHTVLGRSLSFFVNGAPNKQVLADIHCTLGQNDSYKFKQPRSYRDIFEMAGKWFATARIDAILKPPRFTQGWHVAGQYGIVLRDIEVLAEFEPATGFPGFFGIARCAGCDRPVAKGARHRCTLK